MAVRLLPHGVLPEPRVRAPLSYVHDLERTVAALARRVEELQVKEVHAEERQTERCTVAAHAIQRGEDVLTPLGVPLHRLTPTEFRIAVVLAENLTIVVPTPELIVRVWGEEWAGSTWHLAAVNITRLRKKLAACRFEIVTRPNVGYMGRERSA